MDTLCIKSIPVTDIIVYNKNVKEHGDEQVRQIANSIKEFGFTNPILIDEKNEIVAGHGRYAAAKLLGLETVPVIQISHLSDKQKRAYRIADNKIAEKSGWNTDLLKMELSELETICDFDIQLTGFDTIEVDTLLTNTKTKKISEKENSVQFITDEEIITKPGDLWLIGNHKLLCGSSLEEGSFIRLIDGKTADLVVQDPPYNLSAKSIGSSGNTKHTDFQMASGEMTSAEFTKFLSNNFALCSKYSNKNALIYNFMDWRHCREILDAGEANFGSLINLCVWKKPTGGMGKLYRSQHELCFVFNNGDKHYIDNVELGKHGRYRTNCWEYGAVGSFGVHKSDIVMHPTVKPYEMIKDIILDASPRNGIVLDSFIGSGTCFIAAEKAKRRCYGIELEPKYCDTAIRRMHDLFGIDAVNAESGKTYTQILSEIKGDIK